MSTEKINSHDLIMRELSESVDYGKLDFTEDDGTDPLHVDAFFHTEKVKVFQQNKLASIWGVWYKEELVGCFTLSMFGISTTKLSDDELVGAKASALKSYPAILLGQLGVDKSFRGRGVGYGICRLLIGLAVKISSKVACRYIVLQTSKDKIKLYEKLGFTKSQKQPNDAGIIWMYKNVV